MNYCTKETIKDWLATLALVILGSFIGSCAAIIVTKDVIQTRPMVCLGGEYSIFCEEVKNDN